MPLLSECLIFPLRCFSGCREYGHQFTGFVKQLFDLLIIHQTLIPDKLGPEIGFIHLLDDNAQFGNETGLGLCDAGRSIVGGNRRRPADQLTFNMSSEC